MSKTFKLALLVSALLIQFVTVTNAITYRYDFIPTIGTPLLPGSYLDLSAASGSGFTSTSILNWNIVTPYGTFNKSDSSSLTGLITWNSSGISLLAVTFSSSGNSALLTQSSEIFTGSSGGLAFGSWKSASSVPESADTFILLGGALLVLVAASNYLRGRVGAVA